MCRDESTVQNKMGMGKITHPTIKFPEPSSDFLEMDVLKRNELSIVEDPEQSDMVEGVLTLTHIPSKYSDSSCASFNKCLLKLEWKDLTSVIYGT